MAHFAAGVAVTSFFGQAVKAAAQGNPLYFVLGGVFGLLPDKLDNYLCRFFRHDVEVQPDPLDPNPRQVAEAVAEAVASAHTSGKPRRIKLNTIRLGPECWRRYRIEFDICRKRVTVTCDPPVDSGGRPREDATPTAPSASAALLCSIKLDYLAELTTGTGEATLLEMRPTADKRVIPVFMPSHQRWTHSFIIALLLALIAASVWGTVAGLVGMLAYSVHIGLDQLGYMGSACFYPFQKQRRSGTGMVNLVGGGSNLAVAWLSCLAVFWNLQNAAPEVAGRVALARFVFLGALLPLGCYRIALWIGRKLDTTR